MSDYLIHYGVMGMRWGHRKSGSGGSSSRKSRDTRSVGMRVADARLNSATKKMADSVTRSVSDRKHSSLANRYDKALSKRSTAYSKRGVDTSAADTMTRSLGFNRMHQAAIKGAIKNARKAGDKEAVAIGKKYIKQHKDMEKAIKQAQKLLSKPVKDLTPHEKAVLVSLSQYADRIDKRL